MDFDFDPWNELLNLYVDSKGKVNYIAWKAENQSRLQDWLTGISTLNPETIVNHQQRLALWINIYNAVTILKVLRMYPIDSILPKLWAIPNWLAFYRFFQRPEYTWGDQRYSLNAIEHQILRKQCSDPRIHFAIVCASLGCPLLRQEAYLPETVDAQLTADAQRFINNPEKVYYDSDTNTLYLNPILRWYRKDFLKTVPSIQEYISIYASSAIPTTASLAYLSYDWSLNEYHYKTSEDNLD